VFLFLSGVLLMGCFVLAAFFLRYWRRTDDRFFALFSIAFALLGLERLGLALRNAPEEPLAGMYFIRLAAFLLIIIAILDKNRGTSRGA
jgi:hypothetical protein